MILGFKNTRGHCGLRSVQYISHLRDGYTYIGPKGPGPSPSPSQAELSLTIWNFGHVAGWHSSDIDFKLGKLPLPSTFKFRSSHLVVVKHRNQKMATNIGIMDSAYFVGRSEILAWINSSLQLNLSKVEEVYQSSYCKEFLIVFFFK